MNRVSVKPLSPWRGRVRLSHGQARMLYRAVLGALIDKPPASADAAPFPRGGLEVHVFYTDDAGIRAVNFEQRGIDKATDVLSFPMGTTDIATGRLFLGDVIVSLPRAVEQSKEYGHGYDRELCYLAVHGALHLLGHDHKDDQDRRVMREAEERVMGKLGLGR
jgi:rRNA maturation RNase YbeY